MPTDEFSGQPSSPLDPNTPGPNDLQLVKTPSLLLLVAALATQTLFANRSQETALAAITNHI